MKKIKTIFSSLVFLSPFIASAEVLGRTHEFASEALWIVQNLLIPLAFALALLFFFWGLAKYIRSAGTAKEEGRAIMVWGVVALFVMSSVWGLVKFIQREFDVNDVNTVQIPKFTP